MLITNKEIRQYFSHPLESAYHSRKLLPIHPFEVDRKKLSSDPPELGGSQETFLRSTQFGGDIRKFPPNKLLGCINCLGTWCAMGNNLKKVSLQSNTSDYVTSAAKAVLGTVPFIGSLLVELAGTVIPNQRVDRIAKFAQVLKHGLSNLEEEFIRLQLSNEQFTDLLEEGLRQSARSLTDERRDYIASIIANSLSSQDIEYIESKHLLRILDEINDIEVVWLRSYLGRSTNSGNEFREMHQNLLQPLATSTRSSQKEFDKEALQQSYKEHLMQLGLLKHRYTVDSKTKSPKYNSSTGAPEVSSYDITSLGKLLLRQIGFNL